MSDAKESNCLDYLLVAADRDAEGFPESPIHRHMTSQNRRKRRGGKEHWGPRNVAILGGDPSL